MIKLYHGSNMTVEKPEIRVSDRAMDFGDGFYTASSFEQAIRFTKRIIARVGGDRVVNIYSYDDTMAHQLKVLHFAEPNEAWLDYVIENRKNRTKDVYDMVIGSVANDDVFGTILLLEDGTIDKETAIKALLWKKLPIQYLFKTKKALRFLSFVDTYIPKEGE